MTYAVRLQRRSAAGFPKDAAVRALAALVPPQHTVSLGAPEVTILVDVVELRRRLVPGYHVAVVPVATTPSRSKKNFNLHAAAEETGQGAALRPIIRREAPQTGDRRGEVVPPNTQRSLPRRGKESRDGRARNTPPREVVAAPERPADQPRSRVAVRAHARPRTTS